MQLGPNIVSPFVGGHVRGRILEAFEAAIRTVPGIASVETAASSLVEPVAGVTCDLSFIHEHNAKIGVRSEPHRGVIKRTCTVAAILSARVPLDMSAVEFEDGPVAYCEHVIATCEALAPLADDWWLAGTEWKYAQDSDAPKIQAALTWTVEYNTATADPSSAV